MNFLLNLGLIKRAELCNNKYVCFISLEPIKNHDDIAFVYNSEVGSVPIHKKYNSPELRKQWMSKEKENLIEIAKNVEEKIPELAGITVDYIERTFPSF